MGEILSKTNLKIAFIHNAYIGYRLPFFEKLADLFNIRFFIDYIDPKTMVQKGNFTYNVLRSVQVVKSSTYNITWSPSLPFHLLKGKYNLFVGADIGHPGTFLAFLIARLLRKPFILCNEGWYYNRTFIRSLRQVFLNIIMQNSNAFVVPGIKAKEFLLRCDVDPAKIFIAPNASKPIFGEHIISQSEELREELGVRDKRIVLYLGRLVERKGVEVLIKAFSKVQKKISNSILIIAGEGEERKKLENLCFELKLTNVLFVGYVDEKKKSSYYSIADVFVLPSLNHSGEVWDLVLNEAMLAGKPVISTKAAGASYDLVKNDINGYVVKDGDPEALYKKIEELLRNPEKMKRLGLESKRIVENDFTFDRMIEGFVRAIGYVVG